MLQHVSDHRGYIIREPCTVLDQKLQEQLYRKNQCIRQKTGAQNIVKEIKQYQKKWLHVQRMGRDYQNKYYNIN